MAAACLALPDLHALYYPAQIWDGASPAAGAESGTTSRPGGRGKQLYLGSYDTELDAAR